MNDQRVKISKSMAESTKADNDYKAKVAMSNAELAKIESQAEIVKKLAEIDISEAKRKVAVVVIEQILQERKASVVVEAEIERERRMIVAQTLRDTEFLEIEARARAVEAIEVARARGHAARLDAEANYVRSVVQACGGADGAVKYRLVEKVPELAKYSADALQNIKFDKVVVWDQGNSSEKSGGKNSTANFIGNLVGSVAPVGDLVKNILGINMMDYLGSQVRKNEEEEEGKNEEDKNDSKVEEKNDSKVEQKNEGNL